MFKKNMSEYLGGKSTLSKFKTIPATIFMIIIIILFLLFSFNTSNKIAELSQRINLAKSDLNTINMTIDKEFRNVQNNIQSTATQLQNISNMEHEQSKTLAAIPNDNEFFKKWLMANHQETLKSINDIKVKLEALEKNISTINSEIGIIRANCANSESSAESTNLKNAIQTESI